MRVGDTFRLKAVISDHIWLVAYCQDGKAVGFNFTTRWPNTPDTTCIVTPAEHPDLQHESVIAYQHAVLWEGTTIETLERHGIHKYLNPVSPELLRRIRQGAVDSAFTPNNIKALLRPVL